MRTLGAVHSCVVRTNTQTTTLQTGGGILYFSPAVTVNNAAFSPLILHITQKLFGGFELFHQRIADIRAIEATDLNQRIVQLQQTHNIVTCGFISSRGQCHHRNIWQALTQLTQRTIFRTEIMSPLRNTVCFVHCQHHRIPVSQLLKKVIHHQTFRRNVQQTHLSATTTSNDIQLLFTALGGIQAGRLDAICQQLIHLVFHQGNQRGNHQG